MLRVLCFIRGQCTFHSSTIESKIVNLFVASSSSSLRAKKCSSSFYKEHTFTALYTLCSLRFLPTSDATFCACGHCRDCLNFTAAAPILQRILSSERVRLHKSGENPRSFGAAYSNCFRCHRIALILSPNTSKVYLFKAFPKQHPVDDVSNQKIEYAVWVDRLLSRV